MPSFSTPAAGAAGLLQRPHSAAPRRPGAAANTTPGTRPHSAGLGRQASAVTGPAGPSTAATAQRARPRSAGAGARTATRAPGQLQPYPSMYSSITHTMSPMKGCPPRHMQAKAPSCGSLPGCSNDLLMTAPLHQQCDTVMEAACSSLLLALGREVPHFSPAAQEEEAVGPLADNGCGQSQHAPDMLARMYVHAGLPCEADLQGGALSAATVRHWRVLAAAQSGAVEQVLRQVNSLVGGLSSLAQLASLMRATSRQACQLPCSITSSSCWEALPPEHLRRWLPRLVEALCSCLPSAHPADAAAAVAAVGGGAAAADALSENISSASASRAQVAVAEQQVAVLTTLTEAARQGVTWPEDYQGVYLDTGLLPRVLQLLAATPTPDHTNSRPATQGSQQHGEPRGTQCPGRYSVGSLQSGRPTAAVARVQGAAARLLVAIGALHPQALTACVVHPGAPPSLIHDLVSLASNRSMPLPPRLSAGLLLAHLTTLPTRPCEDDTLDYEDGASASLSISLDSPRSRAAPHTGRPATKGAGSPTSRGARTGGGSLVRSSWGRAGRAGGRQGLVAAQAAEARSAVLKEGGFALFLDLLLAGDHRQQDPDGCKPAVMDALVDVLLDEELCSLVMDAKPPKTATATTCRSLAAQPSHLSSSSGPAGRGGCTKAACTCALHAHAVQLFPEFQSVEAVTRAALRALWSPVKQLVGLMLSERTKRGRTVAAETAASLSELCLHAVRCLVHVAGESGDARRLLQGMRVGARIDAQFLQAVKHVELHQGLLHLRDCVGVAKGRGNEDY